VSSLFLGINNKKEREVFNPLAQNPVGKVEFSLKEEIQL